MTPTAPICPYCGQPARLTDGRDVYPHRDDLFHKRFWKCAPCDAYVGCHSRTTEPLGVPANAELRRARRLLHDDRLDPIWQTADTCGLYDPEDDEARRKIRKAARNRVYAYVADRLGIDRRSAHTAQFDLEQCRRAWSALHGVSYLQIRQWYMERKRAREQEKNNQSDRPANAARVA